MPGFYSNLNNHEERCRGRVRTSTGKLATGHTERTLVVNPRLSGKPDRHYPAFILGSPPPRQEGLSANFNTLQYKFERCNY